MTLSIGLCPMNQPGDRHLIFVNNVGWNFSPNYFKKQSIDRWVHGSHSFSYYLEQD